MHIHEVESKVGLSKKSIRYYEENGLLSPTRDRVNDYRIYTDRDIEKLRKIKFLRDLGVPIRDLKMLDAGELTLRDCMLNRINKIEREQKSFDEVKNACLEILKSSENFETVDITKYSCKMNILGKEGFTLRDIKTNKSKSIVGAVISTFLFSLFFIIMIFSISYFQFMDNDKIPWVIYFVLMSILGIPVVGMIINLISRIKEILGGEEDEASKY